MAKLPLPQILLGLKGREQAKPQERGERLKGQSFCQTRKRDCVLRPCWSLSPVLLGRSEERANI